MNRGINEGWSCGGNSPVWMELDGKLRGAGWGGAPDVEGAVRAWTAGLLSSQ